MKTPDEKYVLPSPSEPERTQAPEHPRQQRRANIAVGISLLAALFTAWQAWEGHQTRADANNTAKLERRAWIAPQNAHFMEPPSSKGSATIEVQYNNPGKEPASDVRPIYKFQQVDTSKFADNTFNSLVEADNICKNVSAAPGADVIYSGEADGYQIHFGLPSNWVGDDVMTGKKAVVLEMCFAYKTVGELHHTSLCYFYRPGITKWQQLNVCTAGNHAD